MFSERSVRLMYSTHALQCNSIFAILKGEVRAADGDECPRNVAGTEEGSKHGEFHLDLCNRESRPGRVMCVAGSEGSVGETARHLARE